MFKFLVDTSVWLDLAKDRDQQTLLTVIDELVKMQKLSLITPRCILDEFERNKSRIVKESTQSLSSVFKRVKDVVNKFGDPQTKEQVVKQLNDVDFKLPFVGEASVELLAQIDVLLKKSEIIETTDQILIKAAQRGVNKKAPFHRQRNSINDAIIIETYISATKVSGASGNRFAFITHNKHDFSHPTSNEKLPHPDLADNFSKIKSLYFTNLAEAVQRISPSLISDLMIEHGDWTFEQRSLQAILEAEKEFEIKIWYNRHKNREYKIKTGEIKIIAKADFGKHNPQNTIVKEIWEGAKQSAKRVEKQYGKKNLVWDDFEWGMMNGKLSALRWMMGDEWDSLYT